MCYVHSSTVHRRILPKEHNIININVCTCTVNIEVSTGPGRMLAGPGPGRIFLNRVGAGRAGPNDFLIRQQSGPDHQFFKDPGRIQLKDQLKNLKFYHFYKISYLIINKSHIFNNVHNLSLIVNKLFFKIQNLSKTFVLLQFFSYFLIKFH